MTRQLSFWKWGRHEDGCRQVESREAKGERELLAILAVMHMEDSFIIYFSKVMISFIQDMNSEVVVMWRPEADSPPDKCVSLTLRLN